MSKSMAYLMHVDWNWIKQRPHFIAEHLSEDYDLDLYFVRNYKNRHAIRNDMASELRSVYQLTKVPYSSKRKSLQIAERVINFNTLLKIYSTHYDYIWITSPIMLQFVNIDRLSRSTIIYDCMDDVLAFPQSKLSEAYLQRLEERLLLSADVFFASSNVLRNKMLSRGAKSNIYIVNNAVSSRMLNVIAKESESLPSRSKNGRFSIIYYGTVASWINFQLLQQLLEQHQDIEIMLIGPIETSIPQHSRLKAIGPVNHSQLSLYANDADALIMPFVVNELIEAVDPVKVYEYIALRKPSLIVRYAETMKFDKYVYLYNGLDELSKLITHIKQEKTPRVEDLQIMEFIQQNTWEQRVSDIINILQSHISTK